MSWTPICRPSPLEAAGRLRNQGLGDQIFPTGESDGGVPGLKKLLVEVKLVDPLKLYNYP